MNRALLFFWLIFIAGCTFQIKTKKNNNHPNFDETVLQIYQKIDNKNTNSDSIKTKFYNFDDLLINGQYKKPQVLYTDAKQKVKFERLLKLKKNLLPKLQNTANDPTLR